METTERSWVWLPQDVSGDWNRLSPGCGGSLFLSPPPPVGTCQTGLTPGSLQEQDRGVKDWPEEACLGVGHKGLPPGPILFCGPAPWILLFPHPHCQVVNRCVKQPFPFKALQTMGRRARRPSGPLFGNVCAHNKPDGRRFIAVFISWGWFGLLPFHHSTLSTTPTHTRSRVTDLW